MKKKDSFEDITHKISFSRNKQRELFLALKDTERAYVLMNLSKHVQKKLISKLDDDVIIETLEQLDPDEITDIVQLMPKSRQRKVIPKFKEEIKKTVEILGQFDPKSAAGLMNLDFIRVDVGDSITDVAKQFEVHEKRTGRPPIILVTKGGELKGHFPVHKLGLVDRSDRVGNHAKKVYKIKHDASHREVLELFRKHPHNFVVVVGPQKGVIGVIYSDDLLKLLREQETSSLYDFAGVSDEESVTDGVKQKVLHRYKWLMINLATAFLAALTVKLFDDTISKYVILAVYMPIVAGMGGNAGTQTLAVLVRGIALREIKLENAWNTLRNEIMAGVINGAINGVLVALVVIAVSHNVTVALVLALAMIINLFVAGLFGTLVPLVMQKLGKDPATSATIFITMATDILGFLAFLGLATLILN